ncbi:MAG: hypothetical protein LBQ54_15920 [Planctomycetaceae bacterium]|jgi:hypothetical protein|nr:hypothetical protein [Planctomycetaceae bacterium]
MVSFTLFYAFTLIFELIHSFSRVRVPRVMMWSFAATGFFLHVVYLFGQIFFQNGHIFDSIRGWMLTVSWLGMILYLYFSFQYPKTPFPLFLMPLVLISIALAVHFADATPFPMESVGYWWRILHGVAFLLATLASFLGFLTGIMYFLQIYHLKRIQPVKERWKLPSVEWLQRENSRSVVFLGFALGLGILSGIAINQMNHSGRTMITSADPMIGMTLLLFLFLVIYSRFAKSHQAGKQIALLTILCFVFLTTILITGLFSPSAHWKNLQQNATSPAAGGSL